MYNEGTSNSTVYKCAMHSKCTHKFCIEQASTTDVILYEHGVHEHGHAEVLEARGGAHGIAPCLLEDVDRSMLFGATPGQILKDLNKKYPNGPLPTPQQLYYRKSYITRGFEGGWEIETQRVLDEWVDAYLIDSKDAFDCVQDRCRPIVLGTFEGEGMNHEDTLVQDSGIVFTFKGIVQRWPEMYSAQAASGGLSLTVDGTYSLLHNGWVVIVMGTTSMTRDSWQREDYRGKEGFHHSCRPLLFVLSRTETTIAYQGGFQMLKRAYSMFCETNIEVHSCSMDRAQYILNAVLLEFPGINYLVNCWAHVKRKATAAKPKQRLVDKTYMNTIQHMLRECELAPSLPIFHILCSHMVACMTAAGEQVYADWFLKIYLAENWSGWWCGAGGRCGSPTTQNPLESFNNVIKFIHVMGVRLTLSRFLNEGLAGICQYVLSVLDKCDQFAQCIGDHVEEVLHKPIPSDMVTIAVKLVQTPKAWLFYRI